MGYRKFPFQEGYQFPVLLFCVILFYGLSICEFNRWCYAKASKKIILENELFKFVKIQVLVALLGTTFIYTVIYSLKHLIFGGPVSLLGFSSYWLVLIGISALGTGVHLFIDINKWYKSPPKSTNDQGSSYLIKSGAAEYCVKSDDIGYFNWDKGVPRLIKTNGESIITNYSSLNEIERLLSPGHFFRINRQMIVHRQIITSFKKSQSGKLQLVLTVNNETILASMSRHRKKEFRQWVR